MSSLFSLRASGLLRNSLQCSRSFGIVKQAGTRSSSRFLWTATKKPALASAVSKARSCWKISQWFSRINAQSLGARFASSQQAPPPETQAPPILAPKSVGIWLLISSTLVYAIIVVGGVTRLTESGLSITEWKPVTGTIPPLTQQDWEEEFEKYKATPEFKLLNHQFELEDFKRIFFWEWSHRVLGRLIGVAFVGPLAYFAIKRRISKPLAARLGFLGLLIGAQGALGWYMVKSGLAQSLMDTPGAVPRVSQYRLASHLGLAFLLYAGMFATGINVMKESKFVNGAVDKWMGMTSSAFGDALKKLPVQKFKARAWILTALVFVTALSGAFVAGLDAGLLYNEFPLMGGRLAPPRDELMSSEYAKKADGSDKWWRNIFENPVTVQFDHRVLSLANSTQHNYAEQAMTTYLGVSLLFLRARSLRHVLPPTTMKSMNIALAMVNIQFLLGISTLIHLVPVPLAAAHQAGSVALLTAMIHVLISLRRPSAAAQVWRAMRRAKVTGKAATQL
ncbi:Cytochrome c oxidase assembly protein cox15 [Marasmius crinis-equi]|uniref:Cytochrome c oxidase assembly protein cox15 n=1 Tax=Marasmius crinis-equi TaxID=585013 RepID=A0ABR3FZ04_9AGAR